MCIISSRSYANAVNPHSHFVTTDCSNFVLSFFFAYAVTFCSVRENDVGVQCHVIGLCPHLLVPSRCQHGFMNFRRRSYTTPSVRGFISNVSMFLLLPG